MARNALQILDDLGLLGEDSLIFISENANANAPDGAGRANGLGQATNTAAAVFGLDVAAVAPEETPVDPGMPDLSPDTVPFLSFDIGGTTVIDPPIFSAKPDGAPGGGGGKPPKDDPDSGSSVLSEYTSGGNAKKSFNIDIKFNGDDWTIDLQQAFIDAADYLSTIITADIIDVIIPGMGKIDDIRINAELVEFAIPGVLGSAGPNIIRTDAFGYLPAVATMQFDIAAIESFDLMDVFENIVLHEMLHSLGFGTLWGDDYMGLTTTVDDNDLRFTGDLATAQYALEFDVIAALDPFSDYGVPIETDFGDGTAGGHWDEETFGEELMTGFIDSDGTFTSDMTIAALEDMGYDTTFDEGILNIA